MTPLRKRMLEELQLRNYADFTIERYLDAVRGFAKFIGESPDQASPEQIREYLLHLVKDRKASPNTVQVHRAALKFLFVRTLNQPWFDERVARTRRRPKLPTVLSAEEITRILRPSYKSAMQEGQKFLFQLGKPELVRQACLSAPVGKRLPSDFYVHRSAEESLPALLRVLLFAAGQISSGRLTTTS
jgi:integrase